MPHLLKITLTIFLLVCVWSLSRTNFCVGEYSAAHNNNTTRTHAKLDYDYIIVGAGTSGSVIASRLAEQGHLSVAVVEAGKNQTDNILVRDPSLASEQNHTPLYWNTFSNILKREVHQGRLLGGSSSSNQCAYHRGLPHDWDRIAAAAGNNQWSFKSVLPFFRQSENSSIANPLYHGHGGPMNVVNTAFGPFTKVWQNVAQEMGFSVSTDMNGARPEAFGFEQRTLKTDSSRESTATAFLNPTATKHQSNLKVLPETYVLRILWKKKNSNSLPTDTALTATGVLAVSSRGEIIKLHASKGVILAAGAIRSPFILMHSGIGPKDVLHRVGVPIRVNLPAVGSNLMDNMAIPVTFHSTRLNDDSACTCHPAALVPPSPHATTSPPFYFLSKLNAAQQKFVMVVINAHHQGRGNVSLYSANPLDPPQVNLDLFDNGTFTEPLETFVDGILFARRIVSSKSMQEKYQPIKEVFPGTDFQSREALLNYVRKAYKDGGLFNTSHFAGTCKMGPKSDSIHSVVDSDNLKVKGTTNLYVMDSSVLPDMLCCGTYIPTIAVGEMGAKLLLEHKS